MFLNSVPFASLPTLAASPAMPWKKAILHASDVGVGGMLVFADGNAGGYWRPLQHSNLLANDLDAFTHTGTLTETSARTSGAIILPANLLYSGDIFRISIGATKTGVAGTMRFRLRYGSSATMAANAIIWDSGAITAANTEFGAKADIRHYYVSGGAGYVRVMGSGLPLAQYSGGTTTANTDVAVHEYDTVAGRLFFSITLGSVADSVVVNEFTVELLTGSAA